MNILDLNEDIMSKIKHNLFLKSLMKHQKEFDYNEYIDWKDWEDEKYIDCISLDNGTWLYSAPREKWDDFESDFKTHVLDTFLVEYKKRMYNNS
eukprot:SAG11_NODE_26707_length_341_cov_52.260331_1_plen_94_part_00